MVMIVNRWEDVGPVSGSSLVIRERLVLALLLAVQFMLILDVVVVSVAMPSIQDELGIRTGDLQWVSTSYTLTFGGFMVAAGRLGDLLGRRRMFIAGTALFTISSLMCGVAQQEWQLFLARGIQGIGAAVASPAVLAFLLTSFAGEDRRNRILGLWGAVSAGGAVAGQLIGGVLTDGFGWPSVFLINVPIGICACVAALLLLPADRERSESKLDSVGALTLTLGLVFVVFGISRMAEQGLDETVLGALAVAVVLLALFAIQELRHPQPLVRFGIFRNKSLVGGNLVSIINAVMAMTAVFFSTLYMQQVLGYSALDAGLAFAPVTAVIMVVSGLTGRLTAAYGIRALLVTGAVFTGLGIAALMMMQVGGSYWATVFPGLLLLGIGQGLAFVPMTSAATHGVADEEQGLASGLVTTSQQLGGAVGFATLATIAVAALPNPDTADPAALIGGFRIGYLAGLVLPVFAVVAALLLIPGREPKPTPAATESLTGADR